MNDFSPTTIPLEDVTKLREGLDGLFSVMDTRMDWPRPGQVQFRGKFISDPANSFDELRTRFEQHGYTPMIRGEENRVMVIAMPVVFNPPPSNWYINLLLLVLTILSTLFVGAIGEPGFTGSELWLGWPFSLSMMLILGAHELGHYFAARYHNVPVTLPYFIPMPLSILGTMGAFIRLKAPIKNRRALLDIGAAGPLAGMVFAIPILLYGLYTSEVGPLPTTEYYLEGNSILYALAKMLVFGEFLPNGAIDVQLNQVAWAGWVGLLVTGLNLLPVGQLDGGHVTYVLFGKKAEQFFWPVIFALGGIALFAADGTWVVWILLLFVFGRVHAEPLDDVTPLDPTRRAIAIFTLVLFILVFTPIPLQLISP